jgi:hypothetical protein
MAIDKNRLARSRRSLFIHNPNAVAKSEAKRKLMRRLDFLRKSHAAYAKRKDNNLQSHDSHG